MPEVIWLSLLNATVCTVVPVLSVMMAIERIGPSTSSQIGMVGPIFTILLGALILNETINEWIIGGGLLVIVGIIIFVRPATKSK